MPDAADETRRAAHRLRRDRRDRGAARRRARGAVPRPGVRGGPAPADRDDRRPAARGQPDERPARRDRLHARRPRAARRDAHALPPRAASTTATCSASRSTSIASVSGMAAKMKPGARPPLNSAYFKRMEAIEFAVKFDDGVGSGLDEADVVLVGVSRTSKTPLSIYLGYLGHKAANVPIVKGIEPPPELFEIDARKIVGLTIDAEPPRRDPAARVRGDGRAEPPVRRAGRDLRRARAGRGAPPPARLPRDRRHRALDRGDGAPGPAHRRPSVAHEAHATRSRPVPKWRWALWWTILAPRTSSSTCC